MFEVIKTEGTARRGRFRCAHGGEVQTPVFMNVGTQGAIKGGIDAFDLKELGCQIELSNTYHLHLRPGDDVVRQMGGLHRFMRLGRPHPDGLRRLSGVLSGGSAEDHGGGRHLRQPSWTAAASSWGRRRVCRSSPIWDRTSPWPLTSVWKIRPSTTTPRPAVSEPCGGWSGARRSTIA